MNLYMTFGTLSYLQKIVASHPHEQMLMLQNKLTTILLHETTGSTNFKEPISYQVLKGTGNMHQFSSFVAFHYFSITEEAKPLFESRAEEYLLKHPSSNSAYRILRPIKHNPYLIITFWRQALDFESWNERHPLQEIQQTMAKKKLFTPAYSTKTFSIIEGISKEI